MECPLNFTLDLIQLRFNIFYIWPKAAIQQNSVELNKIRVSLVLGPHNAFYWSQMILLKSSTNPNHLTFQCAIVTDLKTHFSQTFPLKLAHYLDIFMSGNNLRLKGLMAKYFLASPPGTSIKQLFINNTYCIFYWFHQIQTHLSVKKITDI